MQTALRTIWIVTYIGLFLMAFSAPAGAILFAIGVLAAVVFLFVSFFSKTLNLYQKLMHLAATVFTVGLLFKVMHWPFASIVGVAMLMACILMFVIGIVYFVHNRKTNLYKSLCSIMVPFVFLALFLSFQHVAYAHWVMLFAYAGFLVCLVLYLITYIKSKKR